MKTEWVLEVVYKGFDPNFDAELEEAVGRDASGSGAGFGERDMSWHFVQFPAAERAASD